MQEREPWFPGWSAPARLRVRELRYRRIRQGSGMLDFKHTDRTRREFEGLALEHLDPLYSAALRLTKNERDAEDLVQDTFLRAFRFFDKFERGTNIDRKSTRLNSSHLVISYAV